MTSLVIGASSVRRPEQNIGALDQWRFSEEEPAAIDPHAVDSGVDLWADGRRGE